MLIPAPLPFENLSTSGRDGFESALGGSQKSRVGSQNDDSEQPPGFPCSERGVGAAPSQCCCRLLPSRRGVKEVMGSMAIEGIRGNLQESAIYQLWWIDFENSRSASWQEFPRHRVERELREVGEQQNSGCVVLALNEGRRASDARS